MEKAAADPGDYDTASALLHQMGAATRPHQPRRRQPLPPTPATSTSTKTCAPPQAAAILHGEVVWQASNHGEWVAILRFPRIEDVSLSPR